MSAPDEELITADDFLTRYGHCSGVELINGRVVSAGQTPEGLRGIDSMNRSGGLNIAIEVRSHDRKWTDIYKKVVEHLTAGFAVVLILDSVTKAALVYRDDKAPQVFHNGDELTIPDVLPGFAVRVARFFE